MNKILFLAMGVWVLILFSCSSAPTASHRMDEETIRKNAEKSMEDLKQEEDKRRSGQQD